ncbi:MAG: prephenate dehydratase domain-containing protein [Saprospiraceae bacterium]
MKQIKKIAIQGYPGSFHDAVCKQYFDQKVNVIPADNFNILGSLLSSGSVDGAVMAIENSIAGTILQNYRILREEKLWIIGEQYLRIKHNLLINAGTKRSDITEVHSHPMAINQCLIYLRKNLKAKLVETEDTALSAKKLAISKQKNVAVIASKEAARRYGLEILDTDIETNKSNYTRFFFLQQSRARPTIDANKASIYIKIPDKKGQLMKVLQVIDHHDLNLSKLQSYPVLGTLRSYFFHLDIEFDQLQQYLDLKVDLKSITNEYTELGIYKRDEININNNPKS